MPPLVSASDASLLRSIISGPSPTLAEMRAAPGASYGAVVVHSFKCCNAEQWLVADADNGKAMKVRSSVVLRSYILISVSMQFTVECTNLTVDTEVLGSNTCLLAHLQTLQVMLQCTFA
jgi:hypothetical protein